VSLEASNSGRSVTWEPHPDLKVEWFRQKVRTVDGGLGLADPHAEFFDDNLRVVRCSWCQAKLLMGKPNQVKNWVWHRQSSLCIKHGTSTPSIMKFTVTLDREQLRQQAHAPHPPLVDTPCLGIQSVDDQRILSYLQRTSIPGGGSKPRHILCKNLFGAEVRLSDLTPKQMNELR